MKKKVPNKDYWPSGPIKSVIGPESHFTEKNLFIFKFFFMKPWFHKKNQKITTKKHYLRAEKAYYSMRSVTSS